jgi:tetrahydromethanopterin S-methyltransferase subunit G
MDIEELYRVVVQGFASVNDRFDAMNAKFEAKFDAVNDRFDAMNAKFEAKFDAVNAKFDAVNAKIDSGLAAVNQRIDALTVHMDAEFGRVKDALMEHGRQLKDIRAALDRKVDRDEFEARR